MQSLMHFNASKIKKMALPFQSAVAKLHMIARRGELTGKYPDFDSAMAAIPKWAVAGYNNEETVEVGLEKMCKVIDWDYPVMFWLEREFLSRGDEWTNLLDAGGHIGTKYRAFSRLMNLSKVRWEVYELPPMVKAGAEMAERDGIQEKLSFCSDVAKTRKADILLCSGLLQYLDEPFPKFVSRLPARPDVIILNKVALRDGKTIYSLQRGGPAYLPYQIRERGAFLRELDTLGYDVVDAWQIQYLTHAIASHPEEGCSESWGFMLRKR
ncbi:hypothetical protein BLJAPNOD_05231 [Ensifer sp. M14]|uniref:Methyltransferase, TIGR04325 family n=2 Tax=Sinorhizobium sp. M14 TaxID=430451 RepID=A0A142BPL8_9HYPH|nr:methyltransferase, TIGR04325 family [Ensifer sp. M14]AMP35026.1 hypothetical protein pSinB_167 [Sinorhizobium sp. M14]RDL48004.1 hypothetical protein BLJAPNOD_05231 [Ensifer sp. M14]